MRVVAVCLRSLVCVCASGVCRIEEGLGRLRLKRRRPQHRRLQQDHLPRQGHQEQSRHRLFQSRRRASEQGRARKAIADFTQSIKLNASDPAAYRNRGFSYAQTAEYDLAIDDYNQTIKLKPDYASIYYDRGWTYAGKDDHARALNDYNRAIELDQDNPDLFNDRGSSYRRARRSR